ncbi:protein tyrosine phosphatase family protein [Chamaesiphon minutus]|uniref:DSP-PTPase phosphatase fused to NAD+ Kinase domain-containing protein n=1 Tax=Chamaesiphon minutus (strain ATCC 27169 / PCC 6605) TaxID=1173020 RepID=K9UGY1_CHAP6|nr:protein tyrosine phosphatase family protein [Chamaesiphon minutus]AFY93464.1 hypothetical protein Cha6605_2404 [Chamaesiphon minutus PCC 6605]
MMNKQNISANISLYGRSIWQTIASRLRPKNGIEDILNYRYISDRLATSGQPIVPEFSYIARAGYRTVLNLAPPNAANAIPEEEKIVTALGMNYLNIPVVWDNPTHEDFDRFCDVLASRSERPIFVHCAMNMRVSAFVFLYRHLILGISQTEARKSMESVWQPNEVWQNFIASEIAAHQSRSIIED